MTIRLFVLTVAILGTMLPLAGLYLAGVLVLILADTGLEGDVGLFLGTILGWAIPSLVFGVVVGRATSERSMLVAASCVLVAIGVYVILYATRVYTGGILDPAGSTGTMLIRLVIPVALLFTVPILGAHLSGGFRPGVARSVVHAWRTLGSIFSRDVRTVRISAGDRPFVLFAVMLALLMVAAYSIAKRHYYRMAIAYTNHEQLDEALDAYRFYLAMWPFDDSARENLASLYQQLGRQKDAVKEWQRAKNLNPGNYFARSSLYRYYLDQGRHEDALSEAEELLTLTPGNRGEELAKVYEQVAQDAEERQDFEGANSVLRKVIGLGQTPYTSRDAWTRERIASNLKKLGRMKEQAAELEQVVEIIPMNDHAWRRDAWLSLAAAYVDSRDFPKAHDALKEVERIGVLMVETNWASDVPPVYPAGYGYIQIARIHSVSGEPEKAIASLRQAVEAGCKCPDDIAREKDFDSIRGRPEFQRLIGK
jgi:tetratricopeptide (TPR) repeat protein